MDYCHPCQRHLNGAFSCSGCGASADECRAYADSLSGGGDAAVDEHDDTSVGDTREDGGRRSRSRGRGRARDARTGRRDRKAAAHRRRRRRALMIGTGLLLAAGGLSLAELGAEAPPADPRATTVDDDADASPSASATGAAKPDGESADPADAEEADASPEESASPSASGSEKPEPDADEGGPTDRSDSRATADPAPSAPAPTSGPGDAGTPTAGPTVDRPTPRPSPSETCTRFLWWCS
uniref:SCO2400 family protein n=1 Tax=Streptomyces sp. TG1A-60 TaxID=3129111 RepID=UPI00404000BF